MVATSAGRPECVHWTASLPVRAKLQCGTVAIITLQDTSHLRREICVAERLNQQVHAGIQPAVVDDRVVRIASSEQHAQADLPCHRPRCDLGAAHAARQDQIGEQQVLPGGYQQLQRSGAICGFEHLIAELPQARADARRTSSSSRLPARSPAADCRHNGAGDASAAWSGAACRGK
jgi:hypothetical protein